MALTRESLVAFKDPCPLKALERARECTQLLGSSTACVAVLYKGVLKTLNVGDSGFMVVKPRSKQAHTYDMVYRTKEQQHRFNMPFQLSFGPYSDKPSSGDAWEYKANPGDVVLMATDGVWDNLFDEEVMQVSGSLRSSCPPPVTSSNVPGIVLSQGRLEGGCASYCQPLHQVCSCWSAVGQLTVNAGKGWRLQFELPSTSGTTSSSGAFR